MIECPAVSRKVRDGVRSAESRRHVPLDEPRSLTLHTSSSPRLSTAWLPETAWSRSTRSLVGARPSPKVEAPRGTHVAQLVAQAPREGAQVATRLARDVVRQRDAHLYNQASKHRQLRCLVWVRIRRAWSLARSLARLPHLGRDLAHKHEQLAPLLACLGKPKVGVVRAKDEQQANRLCERKSEA